MLDCVVLPDCVVVVEFPDWAFEAGVQVSAAPAINEKIISFFFTDLSFVSIKAIPADILGRTARFACDFGFTPVL